MFDPRSWNAFASSGDSTKTVVHEDGPDRYTVRGNVTTARGLRTLGLDERTGKWGIPEDDSLGNLG